jgi:hypothetical protein
MSKWVTVFSTFWMVLISLPFIYEAKWGIDLLLSAEFRNWSVLAILGFAVVLILTTLLYNLIRIWKRNSKGWVWKIYDFVIIQIVWIACLFSGVLALQRYSSHIWLAESSIKKYCVDSFEHQKCTFLVNKCGKACLKNIDSGTLEGLLKKIQEK